MDTATNAQPDSTWKIMSVYKLIDSAFSSITVSKLASNALTRPPKEVNVSDYVYLLIEFKYA